MNSVIIWTFKDLDFLIHGTRADSMSERLRCTIMPAIRRRSDFSGFLLPAVAGELIGRVQIVRATNC